MIRNVIEQLNALYHKSKSGPLSEEDLAERDRLRKIYLAMIRDQVKASLEGNAQFKAEGVESGDKNKHHCGKGSGCDCGKGHSNGHSNSHGHCH